ncbi:hypothetical protein B9Z19DRAFT_1066093 [Tuber borchii]|uniref:Uncharacterized protein n=1 Tax=Tuber borchii TaxID=42251 RepID=A0A2T6ZNP1_TUBBO|nr:hypothetical protein B9Z19DRAFT_1066093 [Tuber borchii]
MRETRYGNKIRRCKYERLKNRDHVLLYYLEWVEERKDIEERWKEEGENSEWMDVEWLLFSEKGAEEVKKFERKGWMERRRKERCIWNRKAVEEEERLLRNMMSEERVLSKRREEKRQRDLRLRREKMRRRRMEKKNTENNLERKGVTPIASVILSVL